MCSLIFLIWFFAPINGKGNFWTMGNTTSFEAGFFLLPKHGLCIFVHRKCQFCMHFKIKLLLYLVFWQKCSFFRHMRDWVECSCSIVVSAMILSVIGRLLNRISQQLGEFQKHKHMVRQDESWQDKMWVFFQHLFLNHTEIRHWLKNWSADNIQQILNYELAPQIILND